MTEAARIALEALDAAVDAFEPVPDAQGLTRPHSLLEAATAVARIAPSDRALVLSRYASPLGERYEAVEGLPGKPLIYTEWDSGGPGTSGFDHLSRVDLPSGRCAYVELVFNDVTSHSGSLSAQYVLAGTSTRPSAELDFLFLRLLFSTNGDAFHREFTPGTDVIRTGLALETVVDLYVESGFDPIEIEDFANVDGSRGDTDREDERDGTSGEGPEGAWRVEPWADDLYVHPEVPESERQAKLADLRERHRHSRYRTWASAVR